MSGEMKTAETGGATPEARTTWGVPQRQESKPAPKPHEWEPHAESWTRDVANTWAYYRRITGNDEMALELTWLCLNRP